MTQIFPFCAALYLTPYFLPLKNLENDQPLPIPEFMLSAVTQGTMSFRINKSF